VRTPGPRYERAAVNELWHIDLMGPFYLLGATGRARTRHFVALVDDHSRSLLGIRAVRPRRRSGFWPCSRRRSSCAACHTN